MPINIRAAKKSNTNKTKKESAKTNGRQKPITVNGKSFWFYEFKEELRKIKSKNKGKFLKGLDYDIARCALQRRRPELDESFNPQIKIGVHPKWNEDCFMYKNERQEWEPFSLKKAATKSTDSLNHQDISKAFRSEVTEQCYAFKMSELNKAKNKKLLLIYNKNSKNIHCDHVIQMYKLIDSFCESYGISKSSIEVVPHPLYDDSFLFKDRALAKDWQDFHKKYAKLRLVTKEENMDRMLNEDVHQWRFDRQMRNI